MLDSVKGSRFVGRTAFLFLAVFACVATAAALARAQSPIYIGLDADMSSSSAQAGEAIRRGALLAINEVNAGGGVLGRPLELVVRDHRGNPARGLDNMADFAAMPDLVAVVGGLHTPVALHQLNSIHENKIIYLGAWAAGTPVVENGRDPNYVFRVSVRDEFAGAFLVKNALEHGSSNLGLLLERTGWGRSNEKAVTDALQERGMAPVAVEWFNWGISDMTEQLDRLHTAGVDGIILVANPPEGLVVVDSMAKRPKVARMPIISHWGITGGTFPAMAGDKLDEVDLIFLQTFSFIDPPMPRRANRVFKQYMATFPDVKTVRDVPAPPGTAHAYDLVHLLAIAIEQAGTIDREAVRYAMENIELYQGLMRDYNPPFTADRHDALNADDFIVAHYGKDGSILPDQSHEH